MLFERESKMKFRKKPVVIDAVRFTGFDGSPNFIPQELALFLEDAVVTAENGGLIILTLEGKMRANVGDWIIKGVNNEFYPCKPDIFEKTYEPAAPVKAEA
jgi:hypothetical protein